MHHLFLTGIDECYNLLKEVKETLDEFVRQLQFSVDVESTTYYVDSKSTSIDGGSTCDSGFAPVFYYCGKRSVGVNAYTDIVKIVNSIFSNPKKLNILASNLNLDIHQGYLHFSKANLAKHAEEKVSGPDTRLVLHYMIWCVYTRT